MVPYFNLIGHLCSPLKLKHIFLVSSLLLIGLSGCRKEELFTNDPVSLSFSQDSILFDTVFTQSPGSVIKRFVARNEEDRAVRVQITLEGGQPSPFRINVDGVSGTTFSEIEILGNDSVFVFVEATLDQNNVTNPLVIEDHILFNTNGTQQEVLLQAWGQDAYYHVPGPPEEQVQGLPPFGYAAGGFDENGEQICGEVGIWAGDKPHVIFGYQVVDSCNALIIEAGARIHVHGGGGLWVYRYGKIEANGTLEQPIIFQSDRLEPEYAELPGQWDRIWINEGANNADNIFTHVVIKNALIGIQAESDPFGVAGWPLSENKLILNNVKIRNCSAAGILSRNYRIESNNLLIGDCGQYAMALTGAGDYFFNHTTIANYWNYEVRQEPAFIMTNSFNGEARQIEPSEFVNGIIYGNNGNEFQLEIASPEMQQFTFDRFILRTDQATNNSQFFPFQETIYRNQDPGFISVENRDFDLTSGAFARNKAIPIAGNFEAIEDIEGRERCEGFPDLGAYEFCPGE